MAAAGRRASKLVSLVTSCFTGNYVRHWAQHFPETPLQMTPIFDGRAVCYPTDQTLRDYLSWRQADCHINNQYNTCFWALVKSGKTTAEAQAQLRVRHGREAEGAEAFDGAWQVPALQCVCCLAGRVLLPPFAGD